MPPTSNAKNDSPKPAPAGVAATPTGATTKTSKKVVVLMIIAALLIPPLGLIIALMISVNKKRQKKVPLVIALLLASVIGAVVYLSTQTGLINTYTIKYNYQNTSSSELSTVTAGGMSFSKPSQFISTAKKSDQNYSTESFAHLNSAHYPLGYIFTFSYKDSHAKDDKYIKGVNDFMTGAVKNSYRTDYINAIKKQVFDSYPGYNATLGEPQKFTNANIKQNAWSFDLDVTSSNPQVEPMKGKLVYVIGDGTIYYFSLMVIRDNWTSNMATWQTVLSSLKLSA